MGLLLVLASLVLWFVITAMLSKRIPHWLGVTRHTKPISALLFVLLLVVPLAWLTGGFGMEARRLDVQMQELCKKDGGIKVYETVTLPASYFDKEGRLKSLYMSNDVDNSFYRIGDDEYRIISQRTYFLGNAKTDVQGGDGNLARVHLTAVRWKDKTLLGEQTWYARSGGDGFTFGFMPSGNNCSDRLIGLENSVFLKGN